MPVNYSTQFKMSKVRLFNSVSLFWSDHKIAIELHNEVQLTVFHFLLTDTEHHIRNLSPAIVQNPHGCPPFVSWQSKEINQQQVQINPFGI